MGWFLALAVMYGVNDIKRFYPSTKFASFEECSKEAKKLRDGMMERLPHPVNVGCYEAETANDMLSYKLRVLLPQ